MLFYYVQLFVFIFVREIKCYSYQRRRWNFLHLWTVTPNPQGSHTTVPESLSLKEGIQEPFIGRRWQLSTTTLLLCWWVWVPDETKTISASAAPFQSWMPRGCGPGQLFQHPSSLWAAQRLGCHKPTASLLEDVPWTPGQGAEARCKMGLALSVSLPNS